VSSAARLNRVLYSLLLLTFLGPVLLRAEPADFNLPAQSAADALLEFSKQAGTDVLFSFDGLRPVRSVAVVGRFEPEDALRRLLDGTGFAARRNWRGKFVVAAASLTGAIRGQLVDSLGRPVAGLQVRLPSAHLVTITDESGSFSFPTLPPGTYRLVATGEGYRSLEITQVKVTGNQTLVLQPQTLLKADSLVRLDPFVVEARSGPSERGSTLPLTRIAAGNLDLPRTNNDALPFQVLERDQILRSGEINLNEFLQRELLDSDASTIPPEQDPNPSVFIAGSTNLNLRGFGSDETVVLVNGRRLPEVLTATGKTEPPDVNLIPLGLVQRVEVLPISASSIYTGNPVGGVINVILRKNVTDTEITATYSNAARGFNAPQSSLSLQHGQSLLDGKLQVLLNATYTDVDPPTESQLNYHGGHVTAPGSPDRPVYAATPNIRSADGMPLFGPGTSSVTSVAPGADGSGGLAPLAGREGTTDLDLFNPPGSMAASIASVDNPYGRRQRRSAYFGSAVYDVLPWLQLGLDGFYSRIVATRGLDVFNADLALSAASPFNPFGQDVQVSLNETAPALGANYSEARIESYSAVAGLLLKLPSDWRVAFDAQYASNITKYRGLAQPDLDRWQQLVDTGVYNPLRDTQVHGPPPEFYDQVLVYFGGKNRFVTLGNYDTLDTALRVTNQSLSLPTGPGTANFGVDYRIVRLADYTQHLGYGDGSEAGTPVDYIGRTLKRYSAFGELQAPLYPAARLPAWLRSVEGDLALRYVASASSAESNFAPTLAVKLNFNGGLSFRGSFTTANRFPTPYLSRQASSDSSGGTDQESITDPRRGGDKYPVEVSSPVNSNLQTEDAVTETAGLLFQCGQVNHLRIALDFVDTRKTNELYDLTAQGAVDLENIFPDHVVRAPAGPGESAGVITSIYTGAVNAASRHSQDWNLSVDYAWTEWFGGTLDLYGRLVYFQSYKLQLLPVSPEVDELRQPDGVIPGGILKYRSNFGAGWSNDKFGFGLDGRYFYSRVLPETEQLTQGSSHIDPYLAFDAYVQSDLGRWLPWKSSHYGLRGQLRVNNVFGAAFPRYDDDPSGTGVQPYGDWRGRTYSLSLTATF
jgi:outer membrane receptor protein involved in Fe transport